MKATLGQRGQVTIPKSCRDKLGLQTGDVLNFEVRGRTLVARKIQAEDVVRKWRDRGCHPLRVDEYLRGVRG